MANTHSIGSANSERNNRIKNRMTILLGEVPGEPINGNESAPDWQKPSYLATKDLSKIRME